MSKTWNWESKRQRLTQITEKKWVRTLSTYSTNVLFVELTCHHVLCTIQVFIQMSPPYTMWNVLSTYFVLTFNIYGYSTAAALSWWNRGDQINIVITFDPFISLRHQILPFKVVKPRYCSCHLPPKWKCPPLKRSSGIGDLAKSSFSKFKKRFLLPIPLGMLISLLPLMLL